MGEGSLAETGFAGLRKWMGRPAARRPWPPMAVMAHTCGLRGIFPGVRAAGKNDLASFRRQRRRKPGRGCGPFLELPRDEGRGTGSPRSAAIFYWECLLSGSLRSGIAGGRAAAAAGRGTGDGRGRFAARRGSRRLPSSSGSVCCPPGRRAASAAGQARRFHFSGGGASLLRSDRGSGKGERADGTAAGREDLLRRGGGLYQ